MLQQPGADQAGGGVEWRAGKVAGAGPRRAEDKASPRR